MTSLSPLLITLSFGAAAVAYLGVLALAVPAYPRTRQSRWLLAALGASAAWAVVLLAAVWAGAGLSRWTLVLDAAHAAAWILFVAALLRFSPDAVSGRRFATTLAACALAALGVVLLASAGWDGASGGLWNGRPALGAMLVLPLIGLLGLEQVFRNSTFQERRVLKPLAIGVGLVFAIDIFVYSQALLFTQISYGLWGLRGFVNAAAAPLVLFAVKRQPDWSESLFVSRQVVFYTTSLTAAGLYLLAMALGGYWIGAVDARWTPPVQLLFLVFAAGVLFYVLFSRALRTRFKVFLAKHFYRNRYDYREEWLRLIDTLAGRNDEASLPERSVKALAAIIDSRCGELWVLDRTGTAYESHGTWRMAPTRESLAPDDVLVRFLAQSRWVVDTREYAEDPEKYSNAFASDPSHVAEPAILVPLIHAGELFGIARLERPEGLPNLSFEDHDLLKTAGQQVATFLAQERAQEELAETRQFEAFSRLTAFLMHDLKNLIAQQELVVGNAKRFKHRPEFIEDAIGTIESSVQRMRTVLERLQSAGRPEKASRVDVGKLLLEVCSACADREPAPELEDPGSDVRVAIDREKLNMAVTHAVRNAQDATAADGRVHVRLGIEDGRCVIEVADTGSGMEAEFVREHLFKPFDSTKGVKGMGIGAYQMRETLRAAGGDIDVESEVGRGTRLRMSLPLAPDGDRAADQPAA